MDEEEKNKIINIIENENENDFLDFKLELYDFKSSDKKQDFLIDMMSLANSNYPGDRYIIIGARDLPERIIKGDLRGCAYARVSIEKEEQLNSYNSQLKYYE